MTVDPGVVNRALAALGHVASRSALVGLGMTRSDIDEHLRIGTMVRVRRGCYVTALADAEQVHALHLGGRIGCVSALRRLGVWGGHDESLHVCVDRGASRLKAAPPTEYVAGRPTATVWHPLASRKARENRSLRATSGAKRVLHWVPAAPLHNDVVEWVASPSEALRQALHCQSFEQALACADSAVHEGVLTLDTVKQIIAALPRRLHPLANELNPDCGSGYESIFGHRMRLLGYDVSSQYEVPGVGRLDGIIERCVGFEINSVSWHHSEAGFYRDIDRILGSMAFGLPVVQLTPREIDGNWPATEAAIVRLIEDTKRLRLLSGRDRLHSIR